MWDSRVFAEEQVDSYRRRLRPVILVALAAYAAVTLAGQSSVRAAPAGNGSAPLIFSARDTGAEMPLHAEFSPLLLKTHGLGAVLLFALALVQKELVGTVGPHPTPHDRAVFLRRHRRIGYATLALAAVMDTAGLLMAPASAMPYFDVFIYVFFMPWVIIGVGVYWTARARALAAHRAFGNLLFKACLSVPLARVLSPALSSLGWPDTSAYYGGIGVAAAAIGAWAAADLLLPSAAQQKADD